MLSELEIESEYYKIQKHLGRKNQLINTSDRTLTYLVDCNHRLRAIGTHPMSCKSLATFNKEFLTYLFTSENAEKGDYEILRGECWKYKLNTDKTEWKQNLLIYSKEELYDLVLTSQKCVVLDDIHHRIDCTRLAFIGSLTSQDYVYISKYMEAKEILQNNITEDVNLKYPYATGYANVMNMSLQESASAIALQHEMISGYLAESENIRLKYKKIILEETDISKLKPIYDNFVTESDRYGDL
jgi:hypothetical protein